ncbi:MAG: choice-of-anchor D domain-containing protein, partial [Acidobacteria bacterium]|nr:choice-of-anchor D domain-containing protein [Acidobacteriota bacterium]
ALLFSTYLGGGGDDYAYDVAVTPGGDAWLAGFTSSSDFPTTAGAIREARAGGPYDGFVSRLDSAGAALVYSTYLGGSGEDYASGVATDALGNAYAAGTTNSADFPVSAAFQGTYAGGVCGAEPSTFPCYDAFVAKLNAEAGTLDYSTYLGGSGGDSAYGIAVDGDGNAVVAGMTTSSDFPVTAEVVQSAGGGVSVDAFVTKLSSNGSSAVYSTYLGGLGAEAALDIAVDGAGNAYLAGYNFGGDFPLASPTQSAGGGHFDAFLATLNAVGTALAFSTYVGGSGQEKGNGIAVDSSGNAYIAGGTFSTDLPVTEGALQTAYAGGSFEGFVAKLANLGLPAVSPREISLTFPDQGVATASPAEAVTLANSGDAELIISGVTASGDFAQSNDCVSPLAPGLRCTLEVTFSPTDFGPRFGDVTVEHNAYGNPFVVHLAGNGVAAPALEISPQALSFDDQLLGTSSAAQTVTLSNEGQAVLNVSNIVAGPDFAVSHTCASPTPVGGACTITVAFVPTVPGAIADAVTIADNAPGSPHVVSLTGTGLGPALSLSATALEFGGQLVDTASAPQSITLANTGNRPLEIAGIAVSGEFAQSNDCPASVAAGSHCIIAVVFSPAVTGAHAGALAITHNSTAESFAIGLSGMGTDFSISASPASATIGAGQTAGFSLTLTPIAGFSRRVSLACGGAPKAASCAATPEEVEIDGSGAATATVTITTTARSIVPLNFGKPEKSPPFPADAQKLLWLCILTFSAFAVWRNARWRAQIGLGGLLLSAALWAACGGGGSSSTPIPRQGTPAGTYTLTVAASSAGITRSATVTLRVN